MPRVTVKELRLRNYRAFADARLVLRDVTFLVGRNGAGKAHGVLLDAIDEASEEFPIVVSTHSPEVLNHPVARADRIRVFQRAGGASQIFDLSDNVRENLKPPMTVGQLLRSNALWTQAEPARTGAEAGFFEP